MADVPNNPVLVAVATLLAGAYTSHGVGAGRGATVTLVLTQQWEAHLSPGARYGSNVSLASPVYVYRSPDFGVTFDTEPLLAVSIPTTASVNKTQPITLPTGIYAIVMVASSPSVTFFLLTHEQITSIKSAA